MRAELVRQIVYLIIVVVLSACNGGEREVKEAPLILMGGSVRGNALSLTNTVSTFSGSALVSGSIDGVGANARFNAPNGITTDGTNLFVADNINHTIRKIVISTATVTTIAGTAGSYGSTDGIGGEALFHDPLGITTDGTNLFVADYNNNTVRQIVISTGTATTLAGSSGTIGSSDGIGPDARFNGLSAITTDNANLYVCDTFNNLIRKIDISSGSVSTVAGKAGFQGTADGTGPAARFYWPSGITTDGTNLYVSDRGNATIRKIVISTGVVTTIAGVAGNHGFADGIGSAALFYNPMGLTSDGRSLFVTDFVDNIIRKVNISTSEVTTIAGTAGAQGSADGSGQAARFYWPSDITTDGKNLYVVDSQNNTIRKID